VWHGDGLLVDRSSDWTVRTKHFHPLVRRGDRMQTLCCDGDLFVNDARLPLIDSYELPPTGLCSYNRSTKPTIFSTIDGS
jgi:hypothetical protein